MKYQAIKLLNLLRIASLSFVILFFAQCSKYHGETEQFNTDSPGMGTQVVPASSSVATAQMVGAYNSNQNSLEGLINWTGLSGPPTAIHFHGPAAPGRNNMYQFVMVKVPAVATGSMTFKSIFTEAQEESLIKGYFYYDIHTAAFPLGEVRGQILLQ